MGGRLAGAEQSIREHSRVCGDQRSKHSKQRKSSRGSEERIEVTEPHGGPLGRG